jgi:hypothetical protein
VHSVIERIEQIIRQIANAGGVEALAGKVARRGKK